MYNLANTHTRPHYIRRFQLRQWARSEIRAAGKKGWGLFATDAIDKGAFVIEYVGEIIDMAEAHRRLKHCYFGSKKFFILALGAGYLIDATAKGSRARFMNHSCAPNCMCIDRDSLDLIL